MCLGGFSGQIDSIRHKRWNVLLFLFILYQCGFYNTLVFYLLTGFLFLFIAQLSHIQPECVNNKSNDFLVNQVTSTINYRTDNIVTRFLCFGLDIQIEHHLFPNIPHSTLRQIQPVVRDYCAQNGVIYIEMPDVFEMAKSYWWHLYEMSMKPK
jgi:fatty acid desaturase